MALTIAEAFTLFLTRLTPSESQRANAARHRTGVEGSLRAALAVTGFNQTGSFHHGTGVRHLSDVDVLVRLAADRPVSSDTALRWVREALSASFPTTTVRVSRPAVVVEFAGGAETWEVIPGFAIGGRGSAEVFHIPGAAGGWMDTAPLAHLSYVNSVNTEPGLSGGAKKLARLVKAWKYYNNVPVSSFYLEMRAARYLSGQSTFHPLFDVCYLLRDLHGHELAGMNDPTGVASRFAACSSDATRREALSRLATSVSRVGKILASWDSDPVTAFGYLNLLFGGRFPTRT